MKSLIENPNFKVLQYNLALMFVVTKFAKAQNNNLIATNASKEV